MLAAELLKSIAPPRGSILIQRDEKALTVRGIWIPDRSRQSSRAAMATVLRVAPDVRELAAGDRVLLAATAGARQIRLGVRGELVVEVCKPSQVLGVILDADLVESRGEHPFAGFSRAIIEGHSEPLEEGDPRAIQ